MSLLRLSRILLPFSALLVAASVAVFFVPGPVRSIEFTGGTLMELQLEDTVSQQDLAAAITAFRPESASQAALHLSRTRDGTMLVRLPTLDNEEHTALLAHLEETLGGVEELQYTTIGPTVGSSLQRRALWALLAAAVAIVAYLAFAFRAVPRHLSPWTFGVSAIIALLHDILITVGIFTLLSRTTSFQMDTLFVTALLSIMGYSVNDTIIIFDRLRSNLFTADKRTELGDLAARSLIDTLGRTINTLLTTLIMLAALAFFASESIRWFVLTFIVGTVIGTYSSFFVATPVLVWWQRKRKS